MFFFQKDRFSSRLFDQTTFYGQLFKDLKRCKTEVIIESPFISASRMRCLYPVFKDLISRKIVIYVVTRDPSEYEDEFMRDQATNEILRCNELGVQLILQTDHHHRKLAIIDRKILWEGSLNILSFSNSQEIMRRIEDRETTAKMIKFLKLQKLLFKR
jgi:phosphatidylserine/phosphatidylglycerophosphate/cardiolipin synthase-like enzyme